MSATIETEHMLARKATVVRTTDRSKLSAARADVVSGLLLWRLWGRLGWNDIRQRYRRSILGPFWLTVSMGIMVAALGVLYGKLFKQAIDDFLPFFCVGILVWSLISGYLTESGTLFTGSEAYIKQISLPFSIYAYRASWSKLIIFAHNVIIYFATIAYFRIWPGAIAIVAIPALMVVVFNGTVVSLSIGIVSARFRDIPQLISSVVQIVFFLTPVIWKPNSLKDHAFIVEWNPFYHLLEIVRAPLLGTLPTLSNWAAVAIITLINVAVAGALFVRFRARIAYWV
ncbi:ABC transporter permease [Bradyrhizobium genosp. P]|uniref:ABC transporter permease n=1 Tax=Bradyrhizobium genosp. P TaxID=83641 RepID=UPI003CF1643A